MAELQGALREGATRKSLPELRKEAAALEAELKQCAAAHDLHAASSHP